MAKLKLITFGCQANEADSEKIAGVLADEGFELTEAAADADLILLNTCSIREKAEHKVYSLLGTFQKLKTQNPGLKIGLCGCLAQREGERLKDRFPYLDLVAGPGAMIYRIPHLLNGGLDGPVLPRPKEPLPLYIHSPRPRRESRFKAWVSIMEGCNYLCTFCVVPYTRGPERSRPPEDILAEVEDLFRQGYKEITLLGQTVNAYGKNLKPRTRFSDLLRAIDRLVGGAFRVRFTSSHPKDLTPDLIDAMASLESVCEHLHLPVQAGSNRVLKRMGRLYTREDYVTKVRTLKEVIPDIALSTDLIVGFPGESEEDFQDTLTLLEKIRFDSLFAFRYSPRPLTPAVTYPDQVRDEVKAERLNALLKRQDQLSFEQNQNRVGKIEEVLVEEGPDPKLQRSATGRSRRNQLVHFSEEYLSPGQTVSAVITEAYSHYLKAKKSLNNPI
ncbi:MAG: tRNA (N6-isopentenyl adenosine(37)-C2)-methylthiotransferase MiaB [Candidatus Methylomirabilales bacterium]